MTDSLLSLLEVGHVVLKGRREAVSQVLPAVTHDFLFHFPEIVHRDWLMGFYHLSFTGLALNQETSVYVAPGPEGKDDPIVVQPIPGPADAHKEKDNLRPDITPGIACLFSSSFL